MAEITIPIPEIDKVIRNQEKMLQLLNRLLEAPSTVSKYDDGRLMTASEVKSFLRCGTKKLADLVEAGTVEKLNVFGTRPRYRVVPFEDGKSKEVI